MENAVSNQSPSTSLPPGWIERIFVRLQATYGNKFAEMWKGQDMRDVMALWASELARYRGTDISGAFDRMAREHPSWPPTLYEFADLCKAAAKPEAFHALPRPQIDQATVDPRIADLRDKLKMPKSDPLAWSKKLLQRHADGDKTVDPYARKMARDAERIATGGRVQ